MNDYFLLIQNNKIVNILLCIYLCAFEYIHKSDS